MIVDKIRLLYKILTPVFILFLLISLSAENKKVISEELTEVVVTFPRKFPPQCYLNQNGKPEGFAIDIMNQIAKLANLKIIYKPVKSWEDATNSLLNESADIIPNSGITPERLLDSDFTIPVETFNVVTFIRSTTHNVNNLEDLRDRKVAVLAANVGEEIIKNHKKITEVVYQDISAALMDLLAGKVDGLIYPEPVILKLAREAGFEDHLKIAGKPLKEIKRALRVKKGSKLLGRLNKAVKELLNSQEYKKIYSKWYGTPKPYWITARILTEMFSIILLTFIGMIVWRNLSLKSLNSNLNSEINIRKKAERKLKDIQKNLEEIVERRTEELKKK